MPQAGAIIGHDIGGSRNVAGFRNVTVVALVNAVKPEQVCCGSRSGSGMFVVPRYAGDVVPKGEHCSAMTVDELGENVLLGQQSCQFQVRVGNVAVWIVKRYQTSCDVRGEWCSPQHRVKVGLGGRWYPHTTHAASGRIMGSNGYGVVRH